MTKPFVICIDDEVTVLNSLKIELKKAIGDRFMIETAEGAEDALQLLSELQENNCEVAVVLCDYIMPHMKGDTLLKHIHEISPKTIKIMLTGQADIEGVIKAINSAQLYHYIPKPWEPEELKLTVAAAINSYLQAQKLSEQNIKLQHMNEELEKLTKQQAEIIDRRTAELKKANLELQRLATLDDLTNIANRRQFERGLSQEWRRMAREKQFLSLIMCDIDYFKGYNDLYGHPAGDNCLKQVAKAINSCVRRSGDLAARYGGEEFALILPNTNAEGAVCVAENIRAKLKQLEIVHAASKVREYVTLSLGVSSMVPSPKKTTDRLIAAADKALYKAKKQGRAPRSGSLRDRVFFLP